MNIRKHFDQIIIEQTINKVDRLVNELSDSIIAVVMNNDYNFDVFEVDYIGQYKKYPNDICNEQSRDRVVYHIFTNTNYYKDERKILLNELKTYVNFLEQYHIEDVCSNEQTNILKLSTREDN